MKSVVFTLLVCVVMVHSQDYTDQANWGGDCTTGTKQSPIALSTTPTSYTENGDMDLNFHNIVRIGSTTVSTSSEVKFDPDEENVDTGYTIQTDFDKEDTEWEVIQMHWHAPSEHTVDGSTYPAELHIVHQIRDENARDGSLLVVGLFFDTDVSGKGGADEFLDKWDFENLGSGEVTLPVDFFLNEMPKRKFWHYEGSLTTPDCTEGVNWYVMENVNKIEQADLDVIISKIGRDNNRDV